MALKLKIHTVLARLLKERELTTSKLAKLTGVPNSTLSTWLLPSAKPKDPEALARVAKALGTTMHQLLFDEPEEERGDLSDRPHEVMLDGYYRLRLEKVVLKGSKGR